MVQANWDEVPEPTNFDPLPLGWYTVEVEKCTERFTQKQELQFKLEFVVIEGAYTGRKMKDSIFFSTKAIPRAKLIIKRLGVDLGGTMDVTPEMLLGRRCYINTTQIEEQVGKDGKTYRNNKIAFSGYRSIDEAPEPEDDSDLPF